MGEEEKATKAERLKAALAAREEARRAWNDVERTWLRACLRVRAIEQEPGP